MRDAGFKQFITRDAASILFWIVTVLIIATTALVVGTTGQWWQWAVSIVMIVAARITLESVSILFHIHATLIDIKDELVAARQGQELAAKREEQARHQAAIARARAAPASKPVAPPP